MLVSGLASVLPSWFVKISIDGLAALQNNQSTLNILPQQILHFITSNPFFADITKSNLFIWQVDQLKIILPLAIVMVFFIEAIFKFFYQFFARKLGLEIVRSLRERFHQHLNLLSLQKHKSIDSGSFVSVISSDLQNLQSWLAETLMNLFSESFTALFLALWLLVVNWKLTLFSFLVIPLFAIPVVKLGKGIRLNASQGQRYVGLLSSFVNETIKNQTVIKAFNLENWRQEQFRIESNKLFNIFDRWAFFMAIVSPLTNLAGAFGIAVILFFGLKAVSEGVLTVGEFSSFFVTSILLYDPVKRLGRVATIFQSALGVADRIYALLDLPVQEDKSSCETHLPSSVQGSLEFREIGFDYDGSKVFQNFSLVIPAKTSVALVGPSGGGKSTLVSLVPRFYELNSGKILLDNIDISKLNLKELRRQIAIVGQEPLLFTGTIRENILLGAIDLESEILEQKLIEACRDAFVLEFAEKLPSGLDSPVGESGANLSIGQKQRIAIARAFLSNAPIIILDEPTSALDNESQEYVYNSIQKLMETRTVIIIAHRLNTIKTCDKIVYIDNGKIVEQGSHSELLSQEKAYASLYGH